MTFNTITGSGWCRTWWILLATLTACEKKSAPILESAPAAQAPSAALAKRTAGPMRVLAEGDDDKVAPDRRSRIQKELLKRVGADPELAERCPPGANQLGDVRVAREAAAPHREWIAATCGGTDWGPVMAIFEAREGVETFLGAEHEIGEIWNPERLTVYEAGFGPLACWNFGKRHNDRSYGGFNCFSTAGERKVAVFRGITNASAGDWSFTFLTGDTDVIVEEKQRSHEITRWGWSGKQFDRIAATLPTAATARTNPAACNLEALDCGSLRLGELPVANLVERASQARRAARYGEAICLAQRAYGTGEVAKQGAAFYEMSRSWQALGCVAQAKESIQNSLRVRPHTGKGWELACEYCRSLAVGGCEECDGTPTRPAARE